jgi:hypothetical protein
LSFIAAIGSILRLKGGVSNPSFRRDGLAVRPEPKTRGHQPAPGKSRRRPTSTPSAAASVLLPLLAILLTPLRPRIVGCVNESA